MLTDFVTELSVLIYCMSKNYNSILVIINQLMEIVYYKLVKVTINILHIAKLILNIIIQYDNFINFIISNKSLVFTLFFL